MSDPRRHIAIVGNGIAGVTAARHIRKLSDHRITLISDETPEPYSRTALMYVYMRQLRQVDTWLYEKAFWEKNRIDRLQAHVVRIDPEGRELILGDGSHLPWDSLILATGSHPALFDWPGQQLEGVGGLYHLQDLERMERWTQDIRHAVVVGGGLIGIEMAEMLRNRGIGVTFLVREASYSDMLLPPEESAMANREIRSHGIDLRLSTQLQAIEDDGSGRARAILTDRRDRIECGFVGLAAGVHPNINLVRGTGIQTHRGILVNHLLQTSAPDIYAIGDCAELRHPLPGRRSIEPLWYTARMMGQTVAQTITGQPAEYQPGIWFNSAKLLSIEYQTYGQVPVRPDAEHRTLYWEHPEGNRSIRINWHHASGAVTGFNLMGIRFRHEICAGWIHQRKPIGEVIRDIRAACFDPEFYPVYGQALAGQYQAQSGAPGILSPDP